jgi:lysine 2,3-aminomutase
MSNNGDPGGAEKLGGPQIEDYPSTKRTEWVRKNVFRASKRKWNDWRWQLRHRVLRTLETEGKYLPGAITPYYYSLIHNKSESYPLSKTVMPDVKELIVTEDEMADPLGEEHDSPCCGIVHRYPDRVLFLVTSYCSTYCRYCTRSREVGHKDDLNEIQINKALEYIRSHLQIRDVLISGGDPLTMATGKLESIIKRVRAIPTVEIIRIGTKVPVVLPQRITKELVNMLKKYHPIFINIHFTHPDEITDEARKACAMLADAGIPLGSQTVLLKDVNDNTETMKSLMTKLVAIRVRPYYLYQTDLVAGTSHFRTTVKTGKEIIKSLQGNITGFAVPKYVIDAPEGGGKIPVGNDNQIGMNGLYKHVLRNYKGELYEYPDPHLVPLKKTGS